MRLETRVATFGELDGATLYAILRLRVDVFVVEQKCAYPELDGRDTEPGTRHLSLLDDGRIAAYLRILEDEDEDEDEDGDGGTARIGRVLTSPTYRGRGLGKTLMTEALKIVGDRRSVLDAQAHLARFYESFGYRPTGPEYVEDGIPHLPMARAEGPRAATPPAR